MERGISIALDKDGTQYCHEETLVLRWHLSPSPISVWGTKLQQAHLAGAALVSNHASSPAQREPLTAFLGRQVCQGSGSAAALGPVPHGHVHKGIQQAGLQQHFPWHKTASVASVEGNGSGATSEDRMGGWVVFSGNSRSTAHQGKEQCRHVSNTWAILTTSLWSWTAAHKDSEGGWD